MLNCEYPNSARSRSGEENPVIPDTQAQFVPRRAEAFDIAGAIRQVIVDRMKNADGGFPVDCE